MASVEFVSSGHYRVLGSRIRLEKRQGRQIDALLAASRPRRCLGTVVNLANVAGAASRTPRGRAADLLLEETVDLFFPANCAVHRGSRSYDNYFTISVYLYCSS